MLRLIANDRTPLHLPPEPVRMLVLSVSLPEGTDDAAAGEYDVTQDAAETSDRTPPRARLEARISTVVAEGAPEVLLVREGDRVQVGSRHFIVTGLWESGLMGACVEMDQVPAA